MIAKMFYGACAAALVTASAVIAQPAANTATKAKDDTNRQICRAQADTGSRLGRSRVCHTAAEWAELRRETQQNIDRIQTQRTMSGGQ